MCLKATGFHAVTGLMILGLLTACTMKEPTKFTSNKMRVGEDHQITSLETASVNEGTLSALADHYKRYGDGPLMVTVSYGDGADGYTAMTASDKAAALVADLRKKGIRDVRTSITSSGFGNNSLTKFEYSYLYAAAPEGCDDIRNINDESAEAYMGYQMGCETYSAMAKQIVRPEDLLGRDALDTPSGRRLSNQTEGYKSGVQNEPLEGVGVSDANE